jgi:hypothetical protein
VASWPRDTIVLPRNISSEVERSATVQRYHAEFGLSNLPADAITLPLPSPKSIAILTHSRARYLELSEKSLDYVHINITLSRLREYTKRHGYDLLSDFELGGASSPLIGKIRAIKKHMEKSYQWIVWIDIDVFIANPYLSLDTFFSYATSDTHFIWTSDCLPPKAISLLQYEETTTPLINSAFLMVRNSPTGQLYLNQWEKYLRKSGYGSVSTNTTRVIEQLSLIHTLNYLGSKEGHRKTEIILPAYMTLVTADCYESGLFAVHWQPNLKSYVIDSQNITNVVQSVKEKG